MYKFAHFLDCGLLLIQLLLCFIGAKQAAPAAAAAPTLGSTEGLFGQQTGLLFFNDLFFISFIGYFFISYLLF